MDFELKFGDPESIERARRAGQKMDRHARMLSLHGHGPESATCGTCAHLVRLQYANTYLKCRPSGISNGAATDWRAKWAACGLYQAESVSQEGRRS